MTATQQPAVEAGAPPAQWDTVTVLTAYVLLLFAIPSDLRIPALGGAGTLASLVALGSGLWWCWIHLQRSKARPSLAHFPVRILAFSFLGAVLVSYVAATTRPISVSELSQADIGVIRIVVGLSILLLAADALPNPARLRRLLERIAWIGAGLAALGLLQFLTRLPLIDGINIPGMVHSQTFSGTSSRGDFIRSAGTAMSPLEYGAALSVAFPLAITFALYGNRNRHLVLRWLPTALIGSALLISGSRSALLGLAVGVVVMFPAWSGRIRARVAALGVVAIGAIAVLVPGMIGTLRYLFTNTSNDSSAVSRSGSYELVGEFFARSPIVGRGFGTFLPQYRILDNQYLGLLIELGVLGTGLFVLLILVAAGSAVRARKRFADQLDNQLGQALAASVLAGAVLTAFFDAFAFPMAFGAIFLSIGLCGGYWRLSRSEPATDVPAAVPVVRSD